MNITHSPLPWYSIPGKPWLVESQTETGYNFTVVNCSDSYVLDTETQKANAQFIVTACNSHAALLEALEELIAAYSWTLRNGCRANIPEGIVLQQARHAIALAKGEAK